MRPEVTITAARRRSADGLPFMREQVLIVLADSKWNGKKCREEIMNKYKYQTSDKANQEIWICEACKKGKIEVHIDRQMETDRSEH